jgi:hypothetical protein
MSFCKERVESMLCSILRQDLYSDHSSFSLPGRILSGYHEVFLARLLAEIILASV